MDVNFLVNELYDIITSVVGSPPLALHEPSFNSEELLYLTQAIESGYVSSAGKDIFSLEEEIKKVTKSKNVVLTSNGTSALHLSLIASKVKMNDEVLVPSMTFIASANAIKYIGAKPHFVDSDILHLGIDTLKLDKYLTQNAKITPNGCVNKKTGNKIAAILPVHIFGNIGEIENLVELAKKFNLAIIEDAAEALGSTKFSKHAGTYGDFGVISFNGNKIITTGGGGALITDNQDLANLARHISSTAKTPHSYKFQYDQLGYNYRMPNLNACLGLAQIKKLDKFLTQKKILYYRYYEAFKNSRYFTFLTNPKNNNSNNWLNTIFLKDNFSNYLDQVIYKINEKGIGCRPVWDLASEAPHLEDSFSMNLDNAKNLSSKIINIPSSAFLVDKK